MEKILIKLTRFFGSFLFSVCDISKSQRWSVSAEIKNLAYLRHENAKGRHIFLKPVIEDHFLFLDDIRDLTKWHALPSGGYRHGRLIVASSPGNYQIWIKSDRPLSLSEKIYWSRRFGSDPGAHPKDRWGRSPGYRNPKYDDNPLSRLVWCDFVHRARIPVLSSELIEAPSRSVQSAVLNPFKSNRKRFIPGKEISRMDYETGDDSRTDFAYVLALLRRGYMAFDIKDRLKVERLNWDHHGKVDDYIDRTIERAMGVM